MSPILTLIATLATLGNSPEIGIQDGWAFDDDLKPIFTREAAREMKKVGAKWVRLHFRLNAKHASWDEPILKAYDQAVANAKRVGLDVLGLFTYESWPGGQAKWTENSHEAHGGNGDNEYVRDWAAKGFRLMLKRYPGVRVWEVWNEPDCWTDNPPGDKHKLPGMFYIYPSNYAWLLKRAYDEAKSVKNPPKIVLGGLLGMEKPTPEQSVAADYLKALFEAGKRFAGWGQSGPFDSWGFHIYAGDENTLQPGHFETFPANFLRFADRLDPVRKPLWITEVGWPTTHDPASEETQARCLEVAYRALSKFDRVGPVFWFKWRDEPQAGLLYGLVRTDGSNKPAWVALKAWSR